MKLNILKLAHLARPRTHEGAPAAIITPEQALRRSVLACMLWENEFYEDGVSIAGRIRELVPKVAAEKVAALAVEARTAMKLRHAPLLLVREMARHATHRALVAETLVRVIQRADELSEFVAIYWADGRRPLSAQVKKGLAAAFTSFDEYALAKYDRASVVRLRDVLFLSPRKAARHRAGRAVEAAHRRRAHHARHLGGCTLLRWRQAHALGASARRTQARRTRSPAQPSQHEGRRRAASRRSWPRSTPCGPTVSFPSASSPRRVTRRSGKRLSSEQCSVRSKERTGSPDTRSSSSTCPGPWSHRCRAGRRCFAPTQHTASPCCCARSPRR